MTVLIAIEVEGGIVQSVKTNTRHALAYVVDRDVLDFPVPEDLFTETQERIIKRITNDAAVYSGIILGKESD